MNLYDLPFVKGYKTLIGSYIQLVCGLLMALVELLKGVNDCLSGASALTVCFNTLPLLFMGVVAAGNGLVGLGLGHKAARIQDILDVQSSAGVSHTS